MLGEHVASAATVTIAGGSYAKLVIKSKKPVAGLKFKSAFVPIDLRVKGKETVAFAVLEGLYTKPDANLLIRQSKLRVSPEGEFRVSVPLKGKETLVQFVSVGVKGEVETVIVEVQTDWAGVQKRITHGSMKRFRISPGLNFSMIGYKDSRITDYSEKAITFKLGMSYLISPPRWSLEAGGYYTLLPIAKSGGLAEGETEVPAAKFMGINLRLGYLLPFVRDPWSLSVQAGVYYTTMFVQPATFGFSNMAGPQVYPVLRRVLKNGNSLVFYAKFSPVTTGSGALFSDHEFAGGGAYVFVLKNGHTASATLDLSSFSLKILDVAASSSTISVGFGYGL